MEQQTKHIGDTNKMVTAVDWLFDQIPLEWTIKGTALEIFKKAKEMEKDEIENAYKNGLAGMLPQGVNKMTITRILE